MEMDYELRESQLTELYKLMNIIRSEEQMVIKYYTHPPVRSIITTPGLSCFFNI